MNIAVLDFNSVVLEITTTNLLLAEYPGLVQPIDITNISPPAIGSRWDGSSFTAPVAAGQLYNQYTYLSFMEKLSSYPVAAKNIIDAKNHISANAVHQLLSAQVELMFEVLKAADGIDFNNLTSRNNFNLLRAAAFFSQTEYDEIIGNVS